MADAASRATIPFSNASSRHEDGRRRLYRSPARPADWITLERPESEPAEHFGVSGRFRLPDDEPRYQGLRLGRGHPARKPARCAAASRARTTRRLPSRPVRTSGAPMSFSTGPGPGWKETRRPLAPRRFLRRALRRARAVLCSGASRGRILFAPTLAQAGLMPDRVIYAEGRRDVRPLFEEGLRHSGPRRRCRRRGRAPVCKRALEAWPLCSVCFFRLISCNASSPPFS